MVVAEDTETVIANSRTENARMMEAVATTSRGVRGDTERPEIKV